MDCSPLSSLEAKKCREPRAPALGAVRKAPRWLFDGSLRAHPKDDGGGHECTNVHPHGRTLRVFHGGPAPPRPKHGQPPPAHRQPEHAPPPPPFEGMPQAPFDWCSAALGRQGGMTIFRPRKLRGDSPSHTTYPQLSLMKLLINKRNINILVAFRLAQVSPKFV